MVKIDWGHAPSNSFEAGVSRGVLYPPRGPGVAWSGLISVNETPEDAAFKPIYQDGIKTNTSVDLPNYSATIDAYTYPDEFSEIDGSARVCNGLYVEDQARKPFGLSYQTLVGNGTSTTRGHYKIHIIYKALVLPSNKDYATLDATTTPLAFSWRVSTTPVYIPGFRPTSHFIVDSREVGFKFLKEFEEILYGNRDNNARLPSPQELVAIFDKV